MQLAGSLGASVGTTRDERGAPFPPSEARRASGGISAGPSLFVLPGLAVGLRFGINGNRYRAGQSGSNSLYWHVGPALEVYPMQLLGSQATRVMPYLRMGMVVGAGRQWPWRGDGDSAQIGPVDLEFELRSHVYEAGAGVLIMLSQQVGITAGIEHSRQVMRRRDDGWMREESRDNWLRFGAGFSLFLRP